MSPACHLDRLLWKPKNLATLPGARPSKQWWSSWSAARTTGIEGHRLQANRAVSSSSGDKGPEINGSRALLRGQQDPERSEAFLKHQTHASHP